MKLIHNDGNFTPLRVAPVAVGVPPTAAHFRVLA